MRKITSALFISLVALSAVAQEPPKFKAESRLVLVPAVVKDKSGNHLSGLTKDDFKLSQDGKQQAIAVFEEVKVSKETLVPDNAKYPEFSNVVGDLAKARALTVIAFDVINTPVLAMTQVKQDLLKYIGQMAERGEPTALVTLEPGRVRLVYDFTADPKAIVAALKQIHARPVAGQPGSALDNSQAALATVVPDVGSNSGFGAVTVEGFQVLERQLSNWVNAKLNADQMTRVQARQTRRDTLEALRNLAAALKQFPGRKTLIWVTGGFPYSEDTMQLGQPTSERASDRHRTDPSPASTTPGQPAAPGSQAGMANPAGMTDMSADSSVGLTGPEIMRSSANTEAINDHTNTWGTLNDANVAVYPIDARRLVNTAFEVINTEQKYSSQATDRTLAYGKEQETVTTFENMASATGGKPCYGRAEVSNCFKEAVDDGDSYYMIGYYVPEKTKPGWHKLQVKSNSKDANIRSRNGFMYSDVVLSSRPAIQADMASAFTSPMNAVAVPFRGTFLGPVDHNGKKAVQFELHLPFESLTIDNQNGNRMKLDIAAVAFGNDGKVAGKMGQTIDTMLKPEAITQLQAGGLRYKNLLELEPGEYTVNFVVRDNLTGRVGSVRAPLKVQ